MNDNAINSDIEQILEYDGEAWKEKDSGAYVSVLDRYDAAKLFSDHISQDYIEEYNTELKLTNEMTEYLWNERSVTENDTDTELAEYLFSSGVSLTKLKPSVNIDINTVPLTVMSGVFIMAVFSILMYRYIQYRRNKREQYATEDNMDA